MLLVQVFAEQLGAHGDEIVGLAELEGVARLCCRRWSGMLVKSQPRSRGCWWTEFKIFINALVAIPLDCLLVGRVISRAGGIIRIRVYSSGC